MKDGFIKVCACTPKLKVGDVNYNTKEIIKEIELASKNNNKLIVFPELCITAYTCGDLFYQDILLNKAKEALIEITKKTKDFEIISFVGLPIKINQKIYNVAAAVFKGSVLGIIPKQFIPNYNEFYEQRQFSSGKDLDECIEINGETVLVNPNIIFECKEISSLKIACEICEDLWVMNPPSISHAQNGATIIVNLSASNELVGKLEYRRELVSMQSSKLYCGYIYSSAGQGESTTDMVFSGNKFICENGKILKEGELFKQGTISSEIDCDFLEHQRRVASQYKNEKSDYSTIYFSLENNETILTREYSRFPFVPSDSYKLSKRAELILSLQAQALAKRILHTKAKSAVIGISGGLDSALALLATIRTKKILKEEYNEELEVIGITMPCFGTTERTLVNAKRLTKLLGASYLKIAIKTSVNYHLKDIKHKDGVYDITYENAQARERTQVLMDYANQVNGLVIGTGDLSELALGWATYNGDHMSMYAVNSSIPKTLVKYLVTYEALLYGGKIKQTLEDILDTPISPELLPTDGIQIVQKTEDKVGPYELHDFYLYYFVHCGFKPSKIFRLACLTFNGIYDKETIYKWLRTFVYRFFAQQFKRSCIPDGVKVGSVSLSPRADWRMPSDASNNIWIEDLEKIKI